MPGTSVHRSELDELARYLDTIRSFPPLGREEEHRLALAARRGDRAARQKLVRHNLSFVVAVARMQRRGTVRLDDLVQEGSVGLMRAVEKFDPHAGTRFSTYAVWWIRAYIGKYLKEARSAVRPRSGTVAQQDLSLDKPVGDDGEALYLERLQDDRPTPEENCGSSEGDRAVRQALGRIRRRVGELGWDIICNRLQRDSPDTLAQVGHRWGVSRERVRQIEVSTRDFLRRYLEGVRQASKDRDAA